MQPPFVPQHVNAHGKLPAVLGKIGTHLWIEGVAQAQPLKPLEQAVPDLSPPHMLPYARQALQLLPP